MNLNYPGSCKALICENLTFWVVGKGHNFGEMCRAGCDMGGLDVEDKKNTIYLYVLLIIVYIYFADVLWLMLQI